MTFIADVTQSGGGFGDPLERDPAQVERDVRTGRTSPAVADRVYGVRLDGDGSVDEAATGEWRKELRKERLAGRPVPAGESGGRAAAADSEAAVVLHLHEYLDLVRAGGRLAVQCRKCAHVFCGGDENYKSSAVETVMDLEELAGERVPSGEPYRGVFLGYVCPGCATLLSVDVFCPTRNDQRPLWDIQPDCTGLE